MRSSRAWARIGVGLCLAAPMIAQAQTDWVKQKIFDRIKISGSRNLGLHFENISGDKDAYQQGNYGGEGGQRFTDLGYLHIEGKKVANLFNVDLTFQDSRFRDPQDEKLTLGYDEGNWSVGVGDVQGSLLNTNRFTSFSRRLRGLSVGFKTPRFHIKALRTESKGEPRSITVQGNNTRGPYYLQSNQIVRGSERITVDGVAQRFGDDYTIDYTLGAIVFENGTSGTSRIIPPTSTIVATYESFGFSGSSGVLEGAGLSYDIPKGGRIGLAAIRQLSGSSTRNSTRLESFQGFGPATTPYTLDFTPATGQVITIRIDGILQVDGFDYHFDSSNPSVFYVNRFVPSTSTVDVVYVPSSTSDTQGDRQVYSLDYANTIGRTSFSLAQAVGSLSNTSVPRSGTARNAEMTYDFGKGKVSAAARTVDDDFVSVQSAGFNRNEKAIDLNFDYRPSNGRRWQASLQNTSVASVTTTGTQRSRFTRTAVSHQITPSITGNSPLTLSFEETKNRQGADETVLDTTALSTQVNKGAFSTVYSLASSQASGATSASVRTLSAQGRYRASQKLGMTYGASLSQVTSGTDSGTGHQFSLGMDYRPSDKYRAGLTFSDSDSGGVSALGSFAGGYGFGTNGNGFTGAPEIQSSYSAATGRRMQIDLEARPSDSAVLGASLYSLRSEGSVTSNSTTTGANGYATWDVSDALRILANATYSKTSLLGLPTTPISTTLGLNIDGNLGKRWSYSTRVNTLFSDGSGDFNQNSLSFSGNLNYRLANRQSLGFSYSGNKVTGYLPQDETDWSLDYRYQIWESLGLSLVYRNHGVVNRDPSVMSGAYTASGLHLELSFSFGR